MAVTPEALPQAESYAEYMARREPAVVSMAPQDEAARDAGEVESFADHMARRQAEGETESYADYKARRNSAVVPDPLDEAARTGEAVSYADYMARRTAEAAPPTLGPGTAELAVAPPVTTSGGKGFGGAGA